MILCVRQWPRVQGGGARDGQGAAFCDPSPPHTSQTDTEKARLPKQAGFPSLTISRPNPKTLRIIAPCGAQTFRNLPFPHLGHVEPADRPDPVRTIRVPPIVPVQLPLGQNAQPHSSQRVFSGGPDVPRPQPGQFAMVSPRLCNLPQDLGYQSPDANIHEIGDAMERACWAALPPILRALALRKRPRPFLTC